MCTTISDVSCHLILPQAVQSNISKKFYLFIYRIFVQIHCILQMKHNKGESAIMYPSNIVICVCWMVKVIGYHMEKLIHIKFLVEICPLRCKLWWHIYCMISSTCKLASWILKNSLINRL